MTLRVLSVCAVMSADTGIVTYKEKFVCGIAVREFFSYPQMTGVPGI